MPLRHIDGRIQHLFSPIDVGSGITADILGIKSTLSGVDIKLQRMDQFHPLYIYAPETLSSDPPTKYSDFAELYNDYRTVGKPGKIIFDFTELKSTIHINIPSGNYEFFNGTSFHTIKSGISGNVRWFDDTKILTNDFTQLYLEDVTFQHQGTVSPVIDVLSGSSLYLHLQDSIINSIGTVPFIRMRNGSLTNLFDLTERSSFAGGTTPSLSVESVGGPLSALIIYLHDVAAIGANQLKTDSGGIFAIKMFGASASCSKTQTSIVNAASLTLSPPLTQRWQMPGVVTGATTIAECQFLRVNPGTGSVTITLPTANTLTPGTSVCIKSVSTSPISSIVVQRSGTNLVESGISVTMLGGLVVGEFVTDGIAHWWRKSQ